MTGTATVRSLHRYPVKSLLGETVAALDLDTRGVTGDRTWSVRTAAGKIGSGKNTRRFAAVIGLLELRARTDGDTVLVETPGGTSYDVAEPAAAAAISHRVGQPVTLAREGDVSHFDDGPVSLIGTGSIDALARAVGEPVDPARFRANIVLDTPQPYVEDEWMGRDVRVGTAVLHVTMRSPRCVMVDMRTADLPAQPGNLTTVGRIHDACLGVIATVVRPGRICPGEPVVLL